MKYVSRVIAAAMFLVAWAGVDTLQAAEAKIKVMVIGGQNNHDWKKSTPFMAEALNKAGHFEATVYNAPEQGAPRSAWDSWQPKFKDFGCVILDYNGEMWPERVKNDFLDYVRTGGGALVIVHFRVRDVVAVAGASVTIETAELNDGQLPVVTQNGSR